jgi:RNA polymerase sigma factor (sigma-70 family)
MTNTNLESTPWDNAESNFQSWLKGNDGNKSDILTDILKTNYLLTRNRLRGLLSNYCENSLSYLARIEELSEQIMFRLSDRVSESQIEFCIEMPSEEEKNKEIIEGLYSGNQEVFNDLYEYEFPKVVKLVTQNSGSVDNARDIFQDALVILMEKVFYKELHLSCSIGTYLYAISQNLWLSKLRRNKFFISLCKLSFNNSELEVRIIEVENEPENVEGITIAIENLGNPCKQLLELFYYKNQSWDDIANTLGYSNGASARNQKYKCLERLRKQLADINEV